MRERGEVRRVAPQPLWTGRTDEAGAARAGRAGPSCPRAPAAGSSRRARSARGRHRASPRGPAARRPSTSAHLRLDSPRRPRRAARRRPARRAPRDARRRPRAPPRAGSPRPARRRSAYGEPASPSFSALDRPSTTASARGTPRRTSRATPEPVPGRGLVGRAEHAETDARALVEERRVHDDLVARTSCWSSTPAARRTSRSSRPVAANPESAATSAIASANCGRSGSLRASRSLPRPCSAPASSTTRYVGRRCSGTLAQSQASRGTTTPVVDRAQRSSASRSGSSPAGHRGQEGPGPVGRRHEADPEVLRQAPDQGGDQLLAQARDVPGEVVVGDPVEGRDRHVDGQAVVLGAGLEVVADREGQSGVVAAPPDLRVVLGADLVGRRVGEHLRVEGEQLGVGPPSLLPPRVEVHAADDVGADPGVVEVEQRVLVHDDVAAAGAVLELLGLLEQLRGSCGRSAGWCATRRRPGRAG